MLERWLGARARGGRAARAPRRPGRRRSSTTRACASSATTTPRSSTSSIELFVDSTPPLLDELRDGAESGDAEAVRRAAHKLKGSCQNIGAGFMAKLAREIEQREPPAAGRAGRRSKRVFEETCDALRAALLPPAGDDRPRAAGRRRGGPSRRARARARAAPRARLRAPLPRARRAVRPTSRVDAASTATCASCCSRGSRSSAGWRAPRSSAAARRRDPAERIAELRRTSRRRCAASATAGVDERALGRDLPHRRAAVRRAAARTRCCAIRDITDGAGAAALARGAAQRSSSAVLGAARRAACACATPTGACCNFGRRRTAATPDLHPLEWAEHFGLQHPDGSPFGPHEAPLLRALRGETVRDVELRVDGADGRRALLASGGPVHRPGRHALLGAVVATADLTARRDAEGRLRRQRGAPPARRREHERLRLRDRRAGPLDVPLRGLGRARPATTSRSRSGRPSLGVRAPRRPRRARPRVRAAAARRARRARLSHRFLTADRRRALGRRRRCARSAAGTGCRPASWASCATSPTSAARASTPPPSRPSCGC